MLGEQSSRSIRLIEDDEKGQNQVSKLRIRNMIGIIVKHLIGFYNYSRVWKIHIKVEWNFSNGSLTYSCSDQKVIYIYLEKYLQEENKNHIILPLWDDTVNIVVYFGISHHHWEVKIKKTKNSHIPPICSILWMLVLSFVYLYLFSMWIKTLFIGRHESR